MEDVFPALSRPTTRMVTFLQVVYNVDRWYYIYICPVTLLNYTYNQNHLHFMWHFFLEMHICTWLAPVFWRPRCSSCSSGWTCLLEVSKVSTGATIFSGIGICAQIVRLLVWHRRGQPGRVIVGESQTCVCRLTFADGQVALRQKCVMKLASIENIVELDWKKKNVICSQHDKTCCEFVS